MYWYIEDAAISFAYARNWAAGDGLVTFAGGERVEGYSNPSWVALMALVHLLPGGFDGFVSSKAMGFVFGALTVPLVYGIARQTRLNDDGTPRARDAMPLYAAAILAGTAQFAIWNGSGLENSIVNFAMAAAVWRALIEQDARRWPISPVIWLILALSRPEGIAYAALGGFWQMVWALRDRGARGLVPTAVWLTAFFAPWLTYQAIHLDYFAWLFPNTYYAKDDLGDFQPFGWTVKGWKYLRDWAFNLGQGYWLPLYVLALVPPRGKRLYVALAITAVLGAALLIGSAPIAVAPLFTWIDGNASKGIQASLLAPPATVGEGLAFAATVASIAAWVALTAAGVDLAQARRRAGVAGGADVVLYALIAISGVVLAAGAVVALDHGVDAAIQRWPKFGNRNQEQIGALAYGATRAAWLGLGIAGAVIAARRRAIGAATAGDVVFGGLAGLALPWFAIGGYEALQALAAVAPPVDKVFAKWLHAVFVGPALFAGGLAVGFAAVARSLHAGTGGRRDARVEHAIRSAKVALAVALGFLAAEAAYLLLLAAVPTVLPRWTPKYVGFRAIAAFAVALAAPLFAPIERRSRAIVLCWHLAAFALFFALWSGGDWMKQWRWTASMAVPGAVLLAAGLAEVQDRAQWLFGGAIRESRWTWPGHAVGIAFLVLFGAINGHNLATFANRPETGPFSVQKRVNYIKYAAKRLHIDEPVVVLDVDQGAHVFWSGFQMYDIAGLVDVPFGHHNFEKPFVREYMFQEVRPHFAHVHGGWASTSKIPQLPEWKEQYFEIPGYAGSQTAKTLHIGNHVRKDLIVRPAWDGPPDRRVAFEDHVVVESFDVPAAAAGQGMSLYVQIDLRSTIDRLPEDVFRVLLFLANERGDVQTWDLPPGYDWYEVGDWTTAEVVRGRYSLPVPKRLPLGDYQLGVVILGADGHVLRPLAALAPAEDGVVETLPVGFIAGGMASERARVAIGEVRFATPVTITDRAGIKARTGARLDQLRDAAGRDGCEAAEAAWLLAKRLNTGEQAWHDAILPTVAPDLARCWARRTSSADHDVQVASIARARRWDFRDPVVIATAAPLAERWYAAGELARERADWDAAYAAFTDALVADPTLAWARRYAEEARDRRLRIGAAHPTAKEPKPDKPRRALRPPRRSLPNAVEGSEIIPDDPPLGPEPDEGAPRQPDGAGEE